MSRSGRLLITMRKQSSTPASNPVYCARKHSLDKREKKKIMNVLTRSEVRTELFEASKKAAASMATELCMKQTHDITELSKDNLALIVTKDGIQTGIVNVIRGEMRASQYNEYSLNGAVLYRETYYLTDSGTEQKSSVTTSIPEDAVIYRGV